MGCAGLGLAEKCNVCIQVSPPLSRLCPALVSSQRSCEWSRTRADDWIINGVAEQYSRCGDIIDLHWGRYFEALDSASCSWDYYPRCTNIRRSMASLNAHVFLYL